MRPVVLETDAKHQITHIIHIADLHIRAGDYEKARIVEYTHVFTKFINEIRKLEFIDTSLIAIAGDIFHHKGHIDLPGLSILIDFFDSLLDIAPVIIIAGNHDLYQQDASGDDNLNMLKKVFRKHTVNRFYYLQNTGLYEYNNVGIGVVSIKDVLRKTSGSGLVDELPTYPDPSIFAACGPSAINCKIAMFHGSVNDTENGHNIEWFGDYDFGVFGDTHKQQVNTTNEFIWGYPGSLVQQDNGESTDGHGFIIWNIKDKSATANHVTNDYGAITVHKKADSGWFVRFGCKNVVEFDEAIKMTTFPKFPKIRLLGGKQDQLDFAEVMKANGLVPSVLRVTEDVGESILKEFDMYKTMEENINAISNMNNKESWIKYISETYPNIDVAAFIENPSGTICISCEDIIPREIQAKIKTRNEAIMKCIERHDAEFTVSTACPAISLKYMTWDNILCYGKDNYIDFTSPHSPKITLINGENASGKSAVFDIIALCIYGELTSVRTQVNMGKELSAKAICDQKAKYEAAGISVTFTYGGDLYEISRLFNIQAKDPDRIHTYDLTVSKIVNSDIAEVIAESAVASAWISERFGSLQDLELSNMMCQIDINNFFSQPNDTQRQILEKSLNLESITTFSEIIAESVRAYKYIIEALSTFKSGMSEHAAVTVSAKEYEQFDALKASLAKLDSEIAEYDAARLQIRGKMKINAITEKEAALTDKALAKNIADARSRFSAFAIADDERMRVIETRGGIMKELKTIEDKLIELRGHTAADDNSDAADAGADAEYEAAGGGASAENDKFGDDIDVANAAEEAAEPVCEMSADAIRLMREHYDAWASRQMPGWLENPDEVAIEISKIEETILKYTEKGKYIENFAVAKPGTSRPAEFSKITAKHLEPAIATLSMKRGEYIRLIQTRTVPVRLQKDESLWVAKYAKWQAKIGNAAELADAGGLRKRLGELTKYYTQMNQYWESLEETVAKLDEIGAEIREIDSLPFNPECEACKQQSHRKRLVAIMKTAEELKKKKVKLQKYVKDYVKDGVLDMTEIKEEIDTLPDVIKRREYYEATFETMTSEFETWQQARAEWAQIAENAAIISELEGDIAALEWGIYETYTHVLKKNRTVLRDQYDIASKMRDFLRDNDDYCKEWRMIEENTAKLAEWKVWSERHRIIEIRRYHRLLEAARASLSAISDKLSEIEQMDAAAAEVLYLENVELFREYQKINGALLALQSRKQTTQAEYTRLEKTIADANTHGVRMKDIVDLQDSLKAKLELLQKINVCIVGDVKKGIDGFRHWIFANKALPLIQTEMNNFLGSIDTIQVQITFNSRGFIYKIEDRGNTPSMNTISGYQKFIINLAMRMALTQIGRKVNMRTIFIDEGFTSFDAKNIAKIQDIFEILLHRFDNILIVSHMDCIHEIVNARIDIKRAAGSKTSHICHGSEYPKYTRKQLVAALDDAGAEAKTVVKNKGRPKKAV